MLKCHRLTGLIIGIYISLVFVLNSGAATRYVSEKGGHDEVSGFIDWSNAATNIQAVLNISEDGDVILVSNGVYTASDGDAVLTVSKSLDIRGVYGRDVTFINGSNERRGIEIVQPEDAGDPIRLSGFTVTGCTTTHNRGGAGLYVNSIRDVQISDCVFSNNSALCGGGISKTTPKSKLTISNCWIVCNTASGDNGGGFYARESTTDFIDCLIASNSAASNGGGIFLSPGQLRMDSCTVLSNSAASQGGGLSLFSVSDETVICRSTFNENEAGGCGGGIFVRQTAPNVYISNCVIRGNSSQRSGGAAGAGVYFAGEGSIASCLIVSNKATKSWGAGLALGQEFVRCENLTIAHNHANHDAGGGGLHAGPNITSEVCNSIIYDNTMLAGASSLEQRNVYLSSGTVLTFNNVCTTPLSQLNNSAGANNFDANPLFVGWNENDYNFRLQPNSPCMNAGMNLPWMLKAVDLDGNPRIDRFSNQVDIGCYEYVPRGTFFYIR